MGASNLEWQLVVLTGTGGSAVYAVLAARKNNWFMLGTETNPKSYEYARKNVSSNNLENNVSGRRHEKLLLIEAL